MTRSRLLIASLLAYPFCLVLAPYLTWGAGRMALGHWPRPSLDDPKAIGSVVSVLHDLTLLLATAGLGLFFVAWLALVGRSLFRPAERARWVRVTGWMAFLFLLAVGFLRWDPLSVGVWLAD